MAKFPHYLLSCSAGYESYWFDAKAVLAGCAIYPVRAWHFAGNNKSRPISERMQAAETRMPAIRG
jgi:hypothetical protein